jgi:hypothetical protein
MSQKTAPGATPEFKGPIDCAVKLMRTQGPTAFYKVYASFIRYLLFLLTLRLFHLIGFHSKLHTYWFMEHCHMGDIRKVKE